MSEGGAGAIEIGSLGGRRDRREAIAILARAFHEDPVWVSIGPRFSRRWRSLCNRVSFWATLGATLAHEGTRVRLARAGGRASGVTVAFEPGRWPLPESAARHELAWAALAGPLPTLRGIRVERAMHACHISEPHTYLWFVGVEPDLHGSGVGTALMDDLHGFADPLGRPTYLETGTEENVSFYERRGYEVVGEISAPRSDVRMWRMLRSPAA